MLSKIATGRSQHHHQAAAKPDAYQLMSSQLQDRRRQLLPLIWHEILEKAHTTLYDAASCRRIPARHRSNKLNFGHPTLKSFVLIILIFFTPAIMAQSYYNDEDSEREDESLPYVEIKTTRDLQQLGQQALREQKVIFLEISASYCGYCETLEEHIIKPMLRSGDYDDYVLIRKMNIDNYLTIRDFDGNKTSPAQFSYKLHAALTPTLLFIDGRGNEVSERIIGVNTLELYGQYVDDALLEGHRKIKEM